MAIVSSVLLWFMPSDYPFGIFSPLYRLSYFDLCLLITPLVSFGHCIVYPTSIYAFWLPLWYHLAIVSSVLLWFVPSDYPFGIFWPLYRLSYFDLCLLIIPSVSFGHCIFCPSSIDAFWLPLLVSCGHCIVCPTSIYAFWLPLCYMLAIVSSVLLWFMPSDYHIGICWPLYPLSYFNVCLLITPFLYVGHCIVCPTSINAFWLPLCYMLAIVSSVLLRFMTSDYPFGIFWPLYRLSYFDLCLLITSLVSVGPCIVCPTSIYAFWLPIWYLLAIVSSVLLWFMPPDYPFGIFWPLHRLSFFDLCLLITTLVSFAHCIVCPTLIYAFWLPLWYLLAIVSSVLLQCMPSDYPLVSFGHCIVCPTLICAFWLPFAICWPLYRLSYFDKCLLITPLVSFGHFIVCPTLIYAFWLSLRYLLAIVSSVLLWFMPSDYPFGILWPLYRLSYFDWCLLITPLVSFSHWYRLFYFDLCLLIIPSVSFGHWHCIVCASSIDAFSLPFGILWPLYRLSYFDLCLLINSLVSFGHWIVCPTSNNAYWLPLCYMLAIVSSVLLRFMYSAYHIGIFWPLCRLSYFYLCLLITPLLYVGHCIVYPSLICAFWLPLCYMLAIVSSVLLRLMPSDYLFGVFWPLYRLSYFDLCLLITPLVSFGHCIVCPSSIDAFWLPLWYLLAIVSSVVLQCMSSDYPFVIFWPLYRLSFFDWCLLITPLYLLTIVLSVLLWFMPSDYPFGMFWPLYRLSYIDLCLLIIPLGICWPLYRLSFDWCLLITPLVSCGHCIVYPTSIYAFWLPLWYHLAIVSSVLLWFVPSDYPFGIFWPLYRLSYFDLCLLIIPSVSFGHCIFCPSSIDAFWLHLWYLVAIVSSVLLPFMPSDYPFGIIWPLYRLSYFDSCLLITSLVSFDHCIVCHTLIYAFWLPHWYLLAIVSSVLLQCMPSDYPFVICWPLYRLFFFDLCLLITPFIYVGHCIVCPTSINAFWLPLCYMLAIVSSVLLRFMPFDYPFGIFWPLYRLSYFDLCLLITTLVSVGHCIVCPTSMYVFWWPLCYMLAIVSSVLRFMPSDYPLWYLLAIVSSVVLQCMSSDYPFVICWPLYRLSYFDLCLLITSLVSFDHCIVCPTSIYAFWLPFGIFWPLYCLSYFDLCLLITPLVSFGHCIICPTLIYAFWLSSVPSMVSLWPLYRLSYFDLCLLITPFGICWPLYRLSYFNVCLLITPWPLYRLSYFDLCLLITSLVSFDHCIVCPTSIYAFWLPFGILWPLYRLSYFDLCLLITPLVSFGHYIVCPTLICAFWLPLWYLLAIVSSVLLWFMPSDYPFGIFWPLYRLSFFDWCLLITPLVSCGHCIFCTTSIYAFWLPLWYHLAIVSSVLLWFVPSDYPLVSFGHCIVCPSLIYAFWLPLWYLLAIVSSVLLWFMPSDYHFGIFWPLYRLSYFDVCLLITPLVSFGHCIVCPTLICAFWLPLWYLLANCIVCPTLIYAFWLTLRYLLAIVSSVLLRLMPSDYPFGIIWPLYRLSYFDLCLLITPLVSFGHCIVCPSLIYAFWLPLWYLLPIVSSVLLWFMPSDCSFGIFWPLYRLSYLNVCLLITHLVSFGHCIVCPTLICAFWLPLWYLLPIVSSVLLWFAPSDYPFGIYWQIVSSVLLWFMLSD